MFNLRAEELSKSIINLSSHKKHIASPIFLGLAAIIVLGSGCASSGTIQPHQAFRQATPYQAYQGYAVQGNANSSPFAYNNSLPGQVNPAAGFGGGSQTRGFAAQSMPAGFQQGGFPPGGFQQGGFQQGGFQQGGFQPGGFQQGGFQQTFNGGFTSGSC